MQDTIGAEVKRMSKTVMRILTAIAICLMSTVALPVSADKGMTLSTFVADVTPPIGCNIDVGW